MGSARVVMGVWGVRVQCWGSAVRGHLLHVQPGLQHPLAAQWEACSITPVLLPTPLPTRNPSPCWSLAQSSPITALTLFLCSLGIVGCLCTACATLKSGCHPRSG